MKNKLLHTFLFFLCTFSLSCTGFNQNNQKDILYRDSFIKLEKTLVVSLPSDWIKSQDIKKGSELECTVEDHRLVFSPNSNRTNLRTIELDVKNITERVLRWQISSLHKQGYDEIVISNYSDEHYKVIEDLVKHLFVGFM